MKNYLSKLAIVLISVFTLFSCSNDDPKTIDTILDTTTSGAILRTIEEKQKTFNFFDTTSKWVCVVEAQDSQNGKLLKEVILYAKHTKNGVTSAEKVVKVVPASAFQVSGARDLPQGTIEATLAQTLTALNLVSGGYTPSDKFTMRLAMVLTDGRTFSVNNVSTPVTNGYFASPFQYSVQFFCPLANASSFSGNYKVVADAWEDYAIGAIIPVSYVPADGTYKFRISCANNSYITNAASTYILVTINPLTAAVTGASNQGFLYSATPTNVTVTGTVGSCTGDINLNLNFSGQYNVSNQKFSLVKI